MVSSLEERNSNFSSIVFQTTFPETLIQGHDSAVCRTQFKFHAPVRICYQFQTPPASFCKVKRLQIAYRIRRNFLSITISYYYIVRAFSTLLFKGLKKSRYVWIVPGNRCPFSHCKYYMSRHVTIYIIPVKLKTCRLMSRLIIIQIACSQRHINY